MEIISRTLLALLVFYIINAAPTVNGARGKGKHRSEPLNCAAVSCLRPPGCEHEDLFTPPGECCPICRACPYKGQQYSFCPGCDSTCFNLINEETRFCPAVCRPGCGCPGAQLIDTVTGKCVERGSCTNPCATFDCMPNAKCKIYEPTGEPFCEPSCEFSNGGCAKDQICQLKPVQCIRAPCPPVVQCSDRADVCFLEPDVGPCEALIQRYFHNAITQKCELFTYGGCEGNSNNFESLTACQCACGVESDVCDSFKCRRGHQCEVHKPTGEPFCTPNCSLDNGGCSKGELCSLEVVQCVRAPCPPVVQCSDPADVCFLEPDVGPCEALIQRYFHNAITQKCEPFTYGGCEGNSNNFESLTACQCACGVESDVCDSFKCRRGHQCEVHKPTGEPFCTPNCSLDNGGCSKGELCSLEVVQCVRAPCPPVVQCITRCAAVKCANGYRCKIYRPTGEPFCSPDCRINNGGCQDNQKCKLQQVTCIRSPCPPVIKCVDDVCPPTCSKKFCAKKPKAMCSNPGPREIPGCTGSCQLTYCNACIFSSDPVATPPDIDMCPVCSNLSKYKRNSRCFRRWAKCAGRLYSAANPTGDEERSDENIICFNPPCPRRG